MRYYEYETVFPDLFLKSKAKCFYVTGVEICIGCRFVSRLLLQEIFQEREVTEVEKQRSKVKLVVVEDCRESPT